jgi:hypothetical protein
MALSPLSRRAGVLCLTAAVMIVLTQFFGARRMTGIVNGVAGMLIGKEPPRRRRGLCRCRWFTGSSWDLGQAGPRDGSQLRTIRRWQADPMQRPSGALRIGLCIGLPLLANWAWVLIVLVGLPRMIRAPLDDATRPN